MRRVMILFTAASLAGCPPSDAPFIEPAPATKACDYVEQDCPEGMMCAVGPAHPEEQTWARYEHAIGDAHCIDAGRRQLGRTCTADRDAGTHNCAPGLHCLTVDNARTEGVCMQLCDAREPSCATVGLPDAQCQAAYRGGQAVCLEDCNPNQNTCPDGTTCDLYPDYPFAFRYSCVPVGPYGLGQACGIGRCEAGATCMGVCRDFCDAYDDDATCRQGWCQPQRVRDSTQSDDRWYGLCLP